MIQVKLRNRYVLINLKLEMQWNLKDLSCWVNLDIRAPMSKRYEGKL